MPRIPKLSGLPFAAVRKCAPDAGRLDTALVDTRSSVALGARLTALFAGPSGMGKTMSAEIVAAELGLDLFAVDLSCVVSKYIGETEKNLAMVFDEAEATNCVLFFDECDALQGVLH